MSQVETFNEYRPLLFSIAYRMLGRATEAEDILQEAYLRWANVKMDEVQSAKAYLSSIVTRLCLDYLRSAQAQREVYVGPWLPEPLLTTQLPDVAESVEKADSLSLAFLVLLENLSPIERAVFLLHEIFDYDYSEVAAIVGKREANCRQMVHRAREHLVARRPRFEVDEQQRQRITTQFMAACASGDLNGLINLLTTDVMLMSDGGGKALAARKPLQGAEVVARFLLGITKKAQFSTELRLANINGQPGLIGYVKQQPIAVMTLDIAGERVRNVEIVVNPDKLRNIPYLANADSVEAMS